MEIKGDITIKRTGIFERRVDQGLLASAISSTLALLRHDARWQDITATGAQDVTLPVATGLPEGWEVVINASSGDNLTVKDGGAGATVQVITAGTSGAYLFTLIDNSAAAGVWHVTPLFDAGLLPAQRYVETHDATTDWGTAGGGYYTITVTEATHGRGVNPNIQFYEDVGAGVLHEVTPDRSVVAANGDSSFRVPEVPDLRYAGQVVYV